MVQGGLINGAFWQSDTTWDDLRIIPGAFDFAGSSDPTLTDWQPTGLGTTFKLYAFQSTNEVFFTAQMPHGWKVGTSMYPHVHWTPGPHGVVEGTKTVAWTLDYTIADIGGTFGASATLDMTDTCTGVNEAHLMTPTPELDCSAITGPSAMLVCRLYRAAGDTWAGTVPADSPFLLEIDFHYEQDTLGSRTPSAK